MDLTNITRHHAILHDKPFVTLHLFKRLVGEQELDASGIAIGAQLRNDVKATQTIQATLYRFRRSHVAGTEIFQSKRHAGLLRIAYSPYQVQVFYAANEVQLAPFEFSDQTLGYEEIDIHDSSLKQDT